MRIVVVPVILPGAVGKPEQNVMHRVSRKRVVHSGSSDSGSAPASISRPNRSRRARRDWSVA